LKTSATEVIRRGFESTLANWPLIVARVIESLIGGSLAIATIVLIVVPIVISAGVSSWKLPEGGDPGDAFRTMILDHLGLFAWIGVIFVVLVGAGIAIHAFVSAGCAAVFVAAERAAAGSERPRRDAFRAYTQERFFAAARAGWWRLFWLYNATWSVGFLFPLVLLVPVLVGTLMMASAENPWGSVAIGCGGTGLIFFLSLPVFFVVFMWTQKATILLVDREMAVRTAMRKGWRLVRADFGMHAAVSVIIVVIMVGCGAVTSSAATPFMLGMHASNPFTGMFGAVQMGVSLLQNAVTNAVGCWLLASFAAMTAEPAP